jgi:hypothetical protein
MGTMKSETEHLLKQLGDAEWFAAAGQPLPADVRGAVVAIRSWEEAVACCSSLDWENFSLEQKNLLTMHLHQHARDRYRQWNDIVLAVKQTLSPLVDSKLVSAGPWTRVGGGSTAVANAVRWDILGACMELEYADVRGPGYFCGLMAWYLAGRFPCGWGERGENGGIRLYGPEEAGDYDPNELDWVKLVLSYQERIFRPQVLWPRTGQLLVY